MNRIPMVLAIILAAGLAGAAVWAVMTNNSLNETKGKLVAAEYGIALLSAELEQTKGELTETEASLTSTRADLEVTRTDLNSTETELAGTLQKLGIANDELADTRAELKETKSELAGTESELSRTKAEVVSAESKANQARSELPSAQKELATTKDRLTIVEETLEGLGMTISASAECYDVDLTDNTQAKNPTWLELTAFLARDESEAHQYILGEYDCSQFSQAVHDNAEAAGIRAAVVHTAFAGDEVGHALNAFLTTDYGMVYVDCTQSPDKIARVEKGKTLIAIEPTYITRSQIRSNVFWESLLWAVGWYYYVGTTPVSNIEIFW